jgi:hypothetical protein
LNLNFQPLYNDCFLLQFLKLLLCIYIFPSNTFITWLINKALGGDDKRKDKTKKTEKNKWRKYTCWKWNIIFYTGIEEPIFAWYCYMKRSITGSIFRISHFIPKNETRHTFAPKKCRASDMVEIRTLIWFRDSVKWLNYKSMSYQKPDIKYSPIHPWN